MENGSKPIAGIQAPGLYVAEYSASQGCFHVDTLQRTLRLNQANALEQRSLDYQIIAICSSDDEAMEFCNQFKQRQRQRH